MCDEDVHMGHRRHPRLAPYRETQGAVDGRKNSVTSKSSSTIFPSPPVVSFFSTAEGLVKGDTAAIFDNRPSSSTSLSTSEKLLDLLARRIGHRRLIQSFFPTIPWVTN